MSLLVTLAWFSFGTCIAKEVTMIRVSGVPQQQVTNIGVTNNYVGPHLFNRDIEDCTTSMLLEANMPSSFMLTFNGSACTLVTIPTSAVFTSSLSTSTLVDVWVTPDQAQRVQGLAFTSCPANQPYVTSRGQACCQTKITSGAIGCTSPNVALNDPVKCCAGTVSTCLGNYCFTNNQALASASAPSACPDDHPYTVGNGYFCCADYYRITNTSISSTCDGTKVTNTDPFLCCANRIPCPNQNTGCANCAQPGYDFYANIDPNLLGVTFTQCKVYCLTFPNCVSIAYVPNNGGCSPKTRTATAADATTSYVVNSKVPCP